ncbi:Lipopolysaccharide-assembly, LptC-related [Marinomonas aquimarina]|uniref:Lipopolysaccharide-assembly, LptC-related n=1 Tax=Marinomonas aquimarina TaxID=295068 RepID=A0A1A8T7H8_9GAMM|nr:LPS export ABC transporter periplasmic protein LptC [Marinomonas aquimarina]SBS27360.1 Lipopolysaccharide-assembly, LptC-related [Marinomonas aquimarina]
MLDSIKKIAQHKGLAGGVAVALVAAVVFLLGSRPTLYILEEQKLSEAPDFFLEGVQLKSFNEAGQLQETIHADAANHYNAQHTRLTNPVITRSAGNISSIASAKNGLIDDVSDSFTLSEEARVIRYLDQQETARVEASTITYSDEDQTIRGQQQSKLTTQQGITESDSIQFNLVDNTATLDGGVTGHYDVSKP